MDAEWKRSLSITANGTIGLVVNGTLIAAVVLPLLVLGYQALFWLQRGWWLPITLYDGFSYINVEPPYPTPGTWQGLGKIIDWVLGWPLSFSLFAACMMLVWLYAMAHAVWSNRTQT